MGKIDQIVQGIVLGCTTTVDFIKTDLLAKTTTNHHQGQDQDQDQDDHKTDKGKQENGDNGIRSKRVAELLRMIYISVMAHSVGYLLLNAVPYVALHILYAITLSALTGTTPRRDHAIALSTIAGMFHETVNMYAPLAIAELVTRIGHTCYESIFYARLGRLDPRYCWELQHNRSEIPIEDEEDAGEEETSDVGYYMVVSREIEYTVKTSVQRFMLMFFISTMVGIFPTAIVGENTGFVVTGILIIPIVMVILFRRYIELVLLVVIPVVAVGLGIVVLTGAPPSPAAHAGSSSAASPLTSPFSLSEAPPLVFSSLENSATTQSLSKSMFSLGYETKNNNIELVRTILVHLFVYACSIREISLNYLRPYLRKTILARYEQATMISQNMYVLIGFGSVFYVANAVLPMYLSVILYTIGFAGISDFVIKYIKPLEVEKTRKK